MIHKPLQVGKLAAISLTLLLGFVGFFRISSADALIDNPVLADGQFLALLVLPVISFALICLVVCESLVTGYRVLRTDRSLRNQLTDRVGYTILRGIEAAVAFATLVLMFLALPPLFAETTPAPAGVGLILAIFMAGLVTLGASLVRAALELVYY